LQAIDFLHFIGDVIKAKSLYTPEDRKIIIEGSKGAMAITSPFCHFSPSKIVDLTPLRINVFNWFTTILWRDNKRILPFVSLPKLTTPLFLHNLQDLSDGAPFK